MNEPKRPRADGVLAAVGLATVLAAATLLGCGERPGAQAGQQSASAVPGDDAVAPVGALRLLFVSGMVGYLEPCG